MNACPTVSSYLLCVTTHKTNAIAQMSSCLDLRGNWFKENRVDSGVLPSIGFISHQRNTVDGGDKEPCRVFGPKLILPLASVGRQLLANAGFSAVAV